MSERDRFNQKKSPFLEHADMGLFLASDNGKTVGRIAAIDDHTHNATHHDNLAAFGFFEADSDAAARALFTAAEEWARKKGRALMRGPLNPSLNDSAGLLIDGFEDAPFLLMPYNPPEYAGYIERAGYAKVKDLYAWIYELALFNPKVAELAERVKKRHQINIRSIDKKHMNEEIKYFLDIYAKAWKDNWGFVAPTTAEAAHFASELGQIPDMNQVLKGTDGKLFPLGLIRFLFRKRLIDQGRLLLLGVLPEYRGLGLLPLMVHELGQRAANRKVRRVEFSWVLEDNIDINQPAEQGGARRYKTYRIYQKAIA
jgi:GNAT superfamily N-acetyltransferase